MNEYKSVQKYEDTKQVLNKTFRTQTQKHTSGSLKRQLGLHSSAHARALSKSMISNPHSWDIQNDCMTMQV